MGQSERKWNGIPVETGLIFLNTVDNLDCTIYRNTYFVDNNYVMEAILGS